MGRAKINSHKGEGLYEVTYYRDNTKITNAITKVNAEIANIDLALPELESEILYWSGIVAGDITALDELIVAYKACIDGLEEGQNPEVECEIQHQNVTDATKVKIANEANYNLLLDQESRLWATRDKFSAELVRLQSVPADEEVMDLWCIDKCSRPSSQPAVGDWENVGEEIADDEEVGIIEIFNYSTKKYDRWITPSSYGRSSTYTSATHGVSKPSLASNEYGFVYNYETRSTILAQSPKYRIATITSVDKVNGTVQVNINKTKDFDGISLNDGYAEDLETDDITIDYMNKSVQSMKGSAFNDGDEVIIQFDNHFTNPTCIGFTEHPKRYPPKMDFVVYDRFSRKQYTVSWNGSAWVEGAQQSTRFHGAQYWNRRSDGAYLSFGGYMLMPWTWWPDEVDFGMPLERSKVFFGGSIYNPNGSLGLILFNVTSAFLHKTDDITDDLYCMGFEADGGGAWYGQLILLKYVFLTSTWTKSQHYSTSATSYLWAWKYGTVWNEEGTYCITREEDGEAFSTGRKFYLDGSIEWVYGATTDISSSDSDDCGESIQKNTEGEIIVGHYRDGNKPNSFEYVTQDTSQTYYKIVSPAWDYPYKETTETWYGYGFNNDRHYATVEGNTWEYSVAWYDLHETIVPYIYSWKTTPYASSRQRTYMLFDFPWPISQSAHNQTNFKPTVGSSDSTVEYHSVFDYQNVGTKITVSGYDINVKTNPAWQEQVRGDTNLGEVDCPGSNDGVVFKTSARLSAREFGTHSGYGWGVHTSLGAPSMRKNLLVAPNGQFVGLHNDFNNLPDLADGNELGTGIGRPFGSTDIDPYDVPVLLGFTTGWKE